METVSLRYRRRKAQNTRVEEVSRTARGPWMAVRLQTHLDRHCEVGRETVTHVGRS